MSDNVEKRFETNIYIYIYIEGGSKPDTLLGNTFFTGFPSLLILSHNRSLSPDAFY